MSEPARAVNKLSRIIILSVGCEEVKQKNHINARKTKSNYVLSSNPQRAKQLYQYESDSSVDFLAADYDESAPESESGSDEDSQDMKTRPRQKSSRKRRDITKPDKKTPKPVLEVEEFFMDKVIDIDHQPISMIYYTSSASLFMLL